MGTTDLPEIELYTESRAQAEVIPLSWMQDRVEEALPLCLQNSGSGERLLAEFRAIEVTFVSDDTIARIHGEFMQDPTPTDVITFHHGEILTSVETAQREAESHGHTPAEELLLYVIHGLLHLNGHRDLVEAERQTMHRVQEEILRRVISREPDS
ncbi:MAG: rRNA maturation RNase YbeY [Verrucomicrobiota bacterium]